MATQRFVFNYTPDTRINLRRRVTQHSNSVASTVQVNRWYANVKAYVENYDRDAELEVSLTKSVDFYFQQVRTLLNQIYDDSVNGIGGNAPAAPVPLVIPPPAANIIPFDNTIAANIVDPLIQADAAWRLANPAVPATVAGGANPRPDFGPILPGIDTTMDERDFQDFHWQLLEAMAHSGFTGVGDYDQDIIYTLHNMPDETTMLTIRAGTVISQCLPHGVTPFNIGAAHANQIARTAKELDIFFDWGKKHGVPELHNHLSFSAWSYVTDKTLLSDDVRAVMNEVTAIAIRDSAAAEVIDPKAPKTSIDQTRKSAAVTASLYNETRSRHGYQPSQNFQRMHNFRFGGTED